MRALALLALLAGVFATALAQGPAPGPGTTPTGTAPPGGQKHGPPMGGGQVMAWPFAGSARGLVL